MRLAEGLSLRDPLIQVVVIMILDEIYQKEPRRITTLASNIDTILYCYRSDRTPTSSSIVFLNKMLGARRTALLDRRQHQVVLRILN